MSSGRETNISLQVFVQNSSEATLQPAPAGLKAMLSQQTGALPNLSPHVGLVVILLTVLCFAVAHSLRRFFSSEKSGKAGRRKHARSFGTGLAPWDQQTEAGMAAQIASCAKVPDEFTPDPQQAAPSFKLPEKGECDQATCAETAAWVEKSTFDDSNPSLLPSFVAYLAILVMAGIVLSGLLAEQYHDLLLNVPLWLTLSMSAVLFLAPPCFYWFHFRRLASGSTSATTSPGTWPLSHAVVLISCHTPLERLVESFDAIMHQTGTSLRPHVVLAVEAGDDAEDEAVLALRQRMGNRASKLHLTRHSLTEEEMLGSHLLRSSLAMELHEELVHKEGLDPFQIMVTFIDADSILSPTYLANVESHFQEKMPDNGGRTIYSSASNTQHSGLASEGLLSQMYEVMRSHESVFFNPVVQASPQASYSMTLGFAAELNFWEQPQPSADLCMRQENIGAVHTQSLEARIYSCPARSFAERYSSARQQQQAVLECAWQASVLRSVPPRQQARWATFKAALMREISIFSCAFYGCVFAAKVAGLCLALMHWSAFPGNLKACFSALLGLLTWQWVCFWVAEVYLHNRCSESNSIAGLSTGRYALLVVCSPVLWPVAQLVFVIMPTVQCLLEAFFYCAPSQHLRV